MDLMKASMKDLSDASDFWINMGVTALFLSIKNPASKAKLKKLCLKVVKTIKMEYAGDPDFD